MYPPANYFFANIIYFPHMYNILALFFNFFAPYVPCTGFIFCIIFYYHKIKIKSNYLDLILSILPVLKLVAHIPRDHTYITVPTNYSWISMWIDFSTSHFFSFSCGNVIIFNNYLLDSENSTLVNFLLSSQILINSRPQHWKIDNFGLNFPDNYMSRRQ